MSTDFVNYQDSSTDSISPLEIIPAPGLRTGYLALTLGCLLALLLGIPHAARAEAGAKQPFVITADYWCPYTCAENSRMQGFAVDITKEIFEGYGETVVYKVLPFNRAYSQIETSKFQMAVALVDDERRLLLFSEESLAVDRTAIVMRKTKGTNYSGPGMLDGLKVGTASEYTYDDGGQLDQYLEQRRVDQDRIIDIFSDTPMKSLLPMLLSGRIDVFPENIDVIMYVATREGVLDQISIIDTGLGNTLHGGFPRTEEGAANMARFDEGMRRMRASGRFEEIMSAYQLDKESRVK
jgi:polar amino acid transport system substrate-binding protein